jgi:hypothetical protein
LEDASAAKYTDVVVLPTPPFSAAVTMIMGPTLPGFVRKSACRRRCTTDPVIVAPGADQAQARFSTAESFRPVHASYSCIGATAGPNQEAVMTVIIAIAIAVGLVLLCTCTFVVLRRRG